MLKMTIINQQLFFKIKEVMDHSYVIGIFYFHYYITIIKFSCDLIEKKRKNLKILIL